MPWLAGERGYLTCHILRGKENAGAGSNTQEQAHTPKHTQLSKRCMSLAASAGFRTGATPAILAFDLRQINETNFLWMQQRITANMKAKRERMETGGK